MADDSEVEKRNQLGEVMRRILFFILSFILIISARAQVKYDFHSNEPFRLKINGHWINQLPCERLVFQWRTQEKKCTIVTYMSEDDSLVQSVLVKPGYQQSFEWQKVKDLQKWVLGSESIISNMPILDEIPVLDEVYQGNSKCAEPMSDAQFEQFLSSVMDSPMTAQRIKNVNFLSGGICCTVEQCVILMSNFELEDDKLEVLRSLESHIFDWDNKQNLVNSFFTERAKNKALLIIGQ
jgi:hypothetical protein